MGCRRGFALVLLLLAACAPAGTPLPAPTQTLIPPTPTLVHAAATPLPDAGPHVETGERAPVLIPAGAQTLVRLATADLAAHLSENEAAIRLLELEAANWAGDDLGCRALSSQTPGDGASVRGYRLVLAAGNALYEYHTDTSGQVRRCEGDDRATASAEADAADPIAAELAALAQRRLADNLDLPLRRIRVITIEPVTWPDTSLGCPQPDIEYLPAAVEGYRLVLEVGDVEYIFHSDTDRLVSCAVESLPAPEEF